MAMSGYLYGYAESSGYIKLVSGVVQILKFNKYCHSHHNAKQTRELLMRGQACAKRYMMHEYHGSILEILIC